VLRINARRSSKGTFTERKSGGAGGRGEPSFRRQSIIHTGNDQRQVHDSGKENMLRLRGKEGKKLVSLWRLLDAE